MELLNMSIYNKTDIVKFWSRIRHSSLAANIVSLTDFELPRTKFGSCPCDLSHHIGAPQCTKRFDSRNGHTVSNDSDSMNT